LDSIQNYDFFRGHQYTTSPQRGREGVIKLKKWTDIIYGWPLIEFFIGQVKNFSVASEDA
jgi:hypothetical protein